MASKSICTSSSSSVSSRVELQGPTQSSTSSCSMVTSTFRVAPQSIFNSQRWSHILSKTMGTKLSITIVRVHGDDHVSSCYSQSSSSREVREQVVSRSMAWSRHRVERDIRRNIDRSIQSHEHPKDDSRQSIQQSFVRFIHFDSLEPQERWKVLSSIHSTRPSSIPRTTRTRRTRSRRKSRS